MEKKTAKNYKYSGLGIDIIFKEVQLVKIANEWTPKVDVEKLSSKVFSLLTMKASPFTGNEIAFIRTSLELNKSEFGRELRVSHTAVSKWEKSRKKVSTMDIGTELLLKMIMAEKAGASSSKYQEIYKKTKAHSLSSKSEPIVIAEAA